MYTAIVENERGETLELTHNKNYIITKISGLEPPTASINMSAFATIDGALFNSSRIDTRNIVIECSLSGSIERSRIELYRYFKPKKWCRFYYKNGMRDVFIDGYVESFECDLFELGERAQISIICPQPFFKAAQEIITDFSAVMAELGFALDLPQSGIAFSEVSTDVRKTVYNEGEIETGVIIEISAFGTVTDPVIYNVMTSEQLKLNFSMQEGDLITINTNSGEKEITLLRDGETENLLNHLEKNSTWFKLEASDNAFTYSSTSGQEFIVMSILHRDQFEGV